MSLPTEEEIRDMAEELHMLDRDGNYPREKRTQLAAVVMAMRDVPDGGDQPETLTTAQALIRFRIELIEYETPEPVADALVLAAAPALIARDGLIVKENRTP